MPTRQVLVRAKAYPCIHTVFTGTRYPLPYWIHRAYELEIVGHGYTMAPSKRQVRAWALDWLGCAYDNDPNEWEVIIEWN